MKQLFTIILVIVSFTAFSQPWLNKKYIENNNPDNFYIIQKAFYKWADEKNLKTEKGIKRFKRWEWFYEPRVYPTGKYPSSKLIYNESQKHRINTKSTLLNNTWTNITPITLPSPSDTTTINGLGRINSITFSPADSNTIFIGSSQGGVWKTTDNGNTWNCLTDDLPLLRISDICLDPNNVNTIYIATGDINYIGFNTIAAGRNPQYGTGIMKSTDGGATWNTTGLSFNLTDGESSLIRRIFVNPKNSNEIIAAGVDGIYKSFDAAQTFTKINSAMIIDMDINPLDSNTIYCASFYNSSVSTSGAYILRSYDFGNTWDTLNSTIPPTGKVQRTEIAIAPSDTNYVYAFTCAMDEGFYALYKSIDAGNTWKMQSAYDTTGMDSTVVKAPNILGWMDGGLSGFMPDEGGQGTYDLTLAVNPQNPEIIFTGGVNMWGSDDGGKTWDIVTFWIKSFGQSVHADQHVGIYSPYNGKYYQASDGGIDYSDTLMIGNITYVLQNCIDWGAAMAGDYEHMLTPGCYTLPTSWTNISSGLHITEYYRLATSKSNESMIMAGAQDNGTYLYKDGNWLSTWGGDGMEAMIDYDNDSIIYATNYSGTLNRSDDGGYTYTQNLETPITNANETGAWVTPYVMHPNNPNVIYTGFNSVWRSNDKGTTWSKLGTQLSGYSILALAVSRVNPDSVIYASNKYNIYKTVNGGQHWTSITNNLPLSQAMISYIAISSENDNIVWVTLSGYQSGEKVYKTNDGGQTWTNISYNLPNVPANTIVRQRGTTNGVTNALYVGTDIGVYYTNDSLQNTSTPWISYNTGLPNVIVNELEIQYSSQKLRAATYGRGLWETDLFSQSTSINKQNTINNELKIYPNPNNGVFYIYADFNKDVNAKINIFTVTGDKILSINKKITNKSNTKIDLSKFGKGIYIVQVTANNTRYTKRVLIK